MCIHDIIKTNYKTSNQLLNKINNSDFFYKYMEIINPITFSFLPKIARNQKISWPLLIEYEDNPKLSGTSIKVPKVLIKQRWNLNKKILICDINIFLKMMKIATLQLEFYMEDKNDMKLKACWINKSFIVPNGLLANIVNDTKTIISKILED